jgi:hypothetical protein
MHYSDEALATAIERAFRDVAWPSNGGLRPPLSLADVEPILYHIFRYSDDIRRFYLPRFLRFAISDGLDAANRSEWIRMLVTLLNVDREARTPGIDRLLEQAQEQAYLSYTEEQARAVLAWLRFIKANYSSPLLGDELESAIRYWSGKTEGAGNGRGLS